ncbi:MAG: hypothetical protein HY253_05690 [Burkholderiales bacterium]|nr:hypothetical protein [Burkholderiales bacterium]
MKPTEAAIANRPYFEVSLSEIPEGEARFFEWHGKPFWVLHRTEVQIRSIDLNKSLLRDPESKQVRKLDAKMDELTRSNSPEYVVLSLLSNVSPCGVEYRKQAPSGWELPWYGGFVDKCKNAVYDVSGRVYATSQSDATNLIVIPHSILGSRLSAYV